MAHADISIVTEARIVVLDERRVDFGPIFVGQIALRRGQDDALLAAEVLPHEARVALHGLLHCGDVNVRLSTALIAD